MIWPTVIGSKRLYVCVYVCVPVINKFVILTSPLLLLGSEEPIVVVVVVLVVAALVIEVVVEVVAAVEEEASNINVGRLVRMNAMNWEIVIRV